MSTTNLLCPISLHLSGDYPKQTLVGKIRSYVHDGLTTMLKQTMPLPSDARVNLRLKVGLDADQNARNLICPARVTQEAGVDFRGSRLLRSAGTGGMLRRLSSHRRHERLDAHDVHDPGEIVGQDVQRRFGGDPR